MAYVFRLVLLALFLFSSFAFADTFNATNVGGVYPSPTASCNADKNYRNQYPTQYTLIGVTPSGSNFQCNYTFIDSNGTQQNGNFDYSYRNPSDCVAPAVKDSQGVCSTPPPPPPPDPCASKAGKPAGSYFYTAPYSGTTCDGTCMVRPSPNTPAPTFSVCSKRGGGHPTSMTDDIVGCIFPSVYTGANCSYQPSQPPVPPSTPPPPVSPTPPVVTPPDILPPPPVLSPADKAAQGAANVAAAAAAGAAGAAAKAAAGAAGAADGGAAAGAAAAGAAAGAVAGAAAVPSPPDFCADHPKSSICQNPSSLTSGSCANGYLSGFTCSGDAIQCGIAQTQMQQYCQINMPDTNASDAFSKAQTEGSSLSPASSGNRLNVSVAGALDASSPYQGQCNSDTTITFNGQSVTLPFSSWCPTLAALGYLFLACAYLAAGKILGGSV